MKFIAATALVFLLSGCYVVPTAPPPPPRPAVVYAPQPAAPVYYYDTPAYYAYPAYGGYYGPNVALNFGYGHRRW